MIVPRGSDRVSRPRSSVQSFLEKFKAGIFGGGSIFGPGSFFSFVGGPRDSYGFRFLRPLDHPCHLKSRLTPWAATQTGCLCGLKGQLQLDDDVDGRLNLLNFIVQVSRNLVVEFIGLIVRIASVFSLPRPISRFSMRGKWGESADLGNACFRRQRRTKEQ